MSGFEVLGAVVSIAQLGAYVLTVSCKLNEVRCKIRNAPKKLARYDRQLKEIVDITTQMEENPPIRTKELNDYLETIVDKTTAIEGVLTKFTQSSKSRQRWNIISGELCRQLDEYFGEVKSTMRHLVVLITSQGVHGQKELKELVLECTRVAATSTQASTTTPSLRRTEGNFAPMECARRKGASLLIHVTNMSE
ncbi:hypothetical protein EKO27_g6837 [Xylaria grammica]|uniref:Uncharacterized protein n=1 Tax=Xylaria grammica TaxID=363999 RepID=A0A439D1M5_9PEZI|nr:hypothetical protein EKO27_g6837 [Xylaria grammica]